MPIAAGQKLRASEVLVLSEPPRARLVPGSNGSGGNTGGGADAGNRFPNATYTVIRWGAAPTLSGFTWTASAPTRLTCTSAGEFLVTGSAAWAVDGTGSRLAILRKNGVDVDGTAATSPSQASFYAIVSIPPTLVRLAVNDYVELVGYQVNSGGATLSAPPSTAGAQQASFQAVRMSA